MPQKITLKNPIPLELSKQLTKTSQYLLAQNIDGLTRYKPIRKRLKLLYHLAKEKLWRNTRPI